MFYLPQLIGKPIREHQGNPVARSRDRVAAVASDVARRSEDDAEEPVGCAGAGRVVRGWRWARLAARACGVILRPLVVRLRLLGGFGGGVPGGVSRPLCMLATPHCVEMGRMPPSVRSLPGA